MLDYRAICALQAVIETQSFDLAAEKLFITQSAVSQRIRALENDFGKPVLIRTLPYKPTKLGENLLGHYKRIVFLENTLKSTLNSNTPIPKISIALSRDSLETWFLKILKKLDSMWNGNIEIIADDQEITLDYLKKGLVSVCASTNARTLSGCQVKFIGLFDYVLVATPTFIKKHFNPKKDIKENLIQSPHIIFDHKDNLHTRYLKDFFGITTLQTNFHMVPSVAGFREFALNSYAYALIPEIDVKKELQQKKLINLFPDKVWEMPIYWHNWTLENKLYHAFNQQVFELSKSLLRQR